VRPFQHHAILAAWLPHQHPHPWAVPGQSRHRADVVFCGQVSVCAAVWTGVAAAKQCLPLRQKLDHGTRVAPLPIVASGVLHQAAAVCVVVSSRQVCAACVAFPSCWGLCCCLGVLVWQVCSAGANSPGSCVYRGWLSQGSATLLSQHSCRLDRWFCMDARAAVVVQVPDHETAGQLAQCFAAWL
jgi:hypothetical protein